MSDIDVLRDLTGRLTPPRYSELVAVARRRRRRAAVTVAACAAVVLLGADIASTALWGGPNIVTPAQDPSPGPTESSPTVWTPERTRAEGSPVDFLGWSPLGLDAQLYCVGGQACDRYHPYSPYDPENHWALELTQGGRSALFEVRGTPWAIDFNEGSILVQDGSYAAERFRLLRVDGTATELRLLSDLAPAVPGPNVMLVPDLDVYRSGMHGPDGTGEHPYFVDDRDGTLQPLDVPEEIEWWGPNVDEFLWGGNGCRAIWQQPDGNFDHHDADCRDTAPAADPTWNWPGVADWLEPGRMAMVEWNNNGAPQVVHASLDRGATWERIEVEHRDWGDSTEEIANALEDVMRQLG